MPSLASYSPLDVQLPDLSPGTGLYPLHPVGVGTPMIESLTSYITRLAQAHDVSTRALIAEYLRFHLPKMPVTDAWHSKRWGRHFLENAESLNGMTDRVEDWIFALEASTGVGNLRYSTMIIWQGFFAHRGLLRIRRAWCAFCYHDWQAWGQVIYEPLLWALADVSVCPVHRRALAENCPHCGRRPSILTPRSRPGCCPHCHHWLGGKDCDEPSEDSAPAPEGAYVIADWMGELLARVPRLQQPSKDIMWTNLHDCVRDLAGGNAALFARAAGLSACVPVFWFTGRKLPSLSSLSRLCYRFSIPLFRFLTERLVRGDPDWEGARRIIRQREIRLQASRSHCPVLTDPDSPRADISDREIKQALRSALRENPLPTIRQIAWRLGIHQHRIYERFPGFHKILRTARLSRLEAAAKAALLESPPPTLREFVKQRGIDRKSLRKSFPRLYRELARCSAQRRYRRREETRSLLEAACLEEPPPSGRKIAARLGSERGHLKKIFPEIWERIVQRHAEYQKQELSRKRAAFVERVHRIRTDLLIAGKYPSRRRVLPLMAGTELRLEHLIVSEVERAVFAFHSKLRGRDRSNPVLSLGTFSAAGSGTVPALVAYRHWGSDDNSDSTNQTTR